MPQLPHLLRERTKLLQAGFSLVLLAHGGGHAQTGPAYWTEAARPTLERQELYPEVLDGKVYVVGGLRNPNTDYSSYFEAFDPPRDAWTRLAPLPDARHHITLSALKGRLYAVGGFTGPFPHWQAQSTVFVYDPAANRWASGVDLPSPRGEGVAAVVGDKLYMIGGRIRATPQASHFLDHMDTRLNEAFDTATGRWQRRADAPTARNSAASAVINGKVYVVGGRTFSRNADGSARQVNLPTLEVYDPVTNLWETRKPMPLAQGGLAATAANGKLYVFGGEQWIPEHKVFGESWVYDPTSDQWEALPSLPTPRHGLGASAVGNRIHVFGGATKTGGNTATAIHEVLNLP